MDADGKRIESVLDEAKVPRPSIAMVQVGKVLHQGSWRRSIIHRESGRSIVPSVPSYSGIDADRRTGPFREKLSFECPRLREDA